MPTVMVVDDDPFMRDLGRIQLEASGFSVLLKSDGLSALEMAAGCELDLIIMDVAMPGMSGLETLMQLRRLDGHGATPVIILSAWSDDEARREAHRLGATWLDKPAPAAVLVRAALARLDGHGTERAKA